MKIYVNEKKAYKCDLCGREVWSLICQWTDEGWEWLELCDECHLQKF